MYYIMRTNNFHAKCVLLFDEQAYYMRVLILTITLVITVCGIMFHSSSNAILRSNFCLVRGCLKYKNATARGNG